MSTATDSLISGAQGFAAAITPAQMSQVQQVFSMARAIAADLRASKAQLDKMNAQRPKLHADFTAELNRLSGNQSTLATTYSEIAQGLNLLAARLGLQPPNLGFAPVIELVIGATVLAAILSVLWPYVQSVRTQADAHRAEVATKAKAFDSLLAGQISSADYATTAKTAEDWKAWGMKALPYIAVVVGGVFLIQGVIMPYMNRPAPKKRKK
jgi:uncharacterized phage infection (PIP) family protein YhgE